MYGKCVSLKFIACENGCEAEVCKCYFNKQLLCMSIYSMKELPLFTLKTVSKPEEHKNQHASEDILPGGLVG